MARFTQGGSGGGGSVDLPQNLATNASPTFDKIYVTNNSNGTNVYIGDDSILGDVDIANHMSLQGQQDSTKGGILLGNAGTEKISTDGYNLTIGAQDSMEFTTNTSNIVLNPEGDVYRYSVDPNNRVATIGDLPPAADLSTSPQYFAYGAFHDETSFGPYTANTEHSFSYQTTDLSNDVYIGGIDHEQIVMNRDGKFNIAFSAQFHSTSSGAIVYVWLAKNGTAVPWSNTRVDITANNPYAVLAWNFFVEAVAGDYFELRWSTPSSTVKVEALTGLTGTKPNVPSMILTVNQVG